MPRYELAKAQTVSAVDRVMKTYHGRLSDVGVTCDTLLAFANTDVNGDPNGCAIKLHGRECNAKIRIVSTKDRVAGRADVEMIIDGDKLDLWSEEELDALIDHELTHLELCVNSKGGLQRDDHDRPKLKIRLHDREFGWFDEVARRHGEHSFEMTQAKAMIEEDRDFRQLYLIGFEEEVAVVKSSRGGSRKAASMA